MKVVHINTFDNDGGAARAAYRLNKALNEYGIESNMLVLEKKSNDKDIFSIQTSEKVRGILKNNNILQEYLTKKYKNRTQTLFSPGFLGVDLNNYNKLKEADIIHLHWINGGYLSLKSLNKLKKLKKPIVWTFHDMWPFTGGCHYDENCGKYEKNCGNCKVLNSKIDKDLSRDIFNKKRDVYSNLKITGVTCSNWLGECAKKSELMSSKNINVIPNTLEIDTFKPIDKIISRKVLNLPENKFIILCGAMSATSDKRKGFDYLYNAIKLLAEKHKELIDKIEIVIFGASESKELEQLPFKTTFLGTLRDDMSIVHSYNCADVFVAPSIQENLANTVMESLACGTPVLAFNIGGMSDMIEHEVNGYLASEVSHVSLYEGLKYFITNNDSEKFRINARRYVEDNYAPHIIAEKYTELYKSIYVENIYDDKALYLKQRINNKLFIQLRYGYEVYLFYKYKLLKKLFEPQKIYVFPFEKCKNKKKIAIYGAGKVGTDYYKQIKRSRSYKLVAWFDKEYKNVSYKGRKLNSPESILSYDFDCVVIAIENNAIAQSVIEYLMELGVPKYKIIHSIHQKNIRFFNF